jgi:hypothetical protein
MARRVDDEVFGDDAEEWEAIRARRRKAWRTKQKAKRTRTLTAQKRSKRGDSE